MNDILKILFEFGFLALLGVAYYFWQRKKIINNDRLEIYQGLNDLTKDLQSYADKNLKAKDYDELVKMIKEIERHNNSNDYLELSSIFSTPPQTLPQDLKEAFFYFKAQVDFHKS